MATTMRGRTHGDGSRATSVPQDDDRSLGELASDLTQHAQQLMRCEVELAKAEMLAQATRLQRGVAMAAAAAVVGLVGLMMAAHFAAIALIGVMDPWLAYLLVSVALVGTAGALGAAGVGAIRKAKPMPEQALEQTKEDVAWLKSHT